MNETNVLMNWPTQVHSLENQFLPKDWIMERWEEGFYITGMAGSIYTSGSSLVIMSKGTPYTQQSYKVRQGPCRGFGARKRKRLVRLDFGFHSAMSVLQ